MQQQLIVVVELPSQKFSKNATLQGSQIYVILKFSWLLRIHFKWKKNEI